MNSKEIKYIEDLYDVYIITTGKRFKKIRYILYSKEFEQHLGEFKNFKDLIGECVKRHKLGEL